MVKIKFLKVKIQNLTKSRTNCAPGWKRVQIDLNCFLEELKESNTKVLKAKSQS